MADFSDISEDEELDMLDELELEDSGEPLLIGILFVLSCSILLMLILFFRNLHEFLFFCYSIQLYTKYKKMHLYPIFNKIVLTLTLNFRIY